MVVHLDLLAEELVVVLAQVGRRRQAGEELLEPVVVDEHRVGLAEVFELAFEDALPGRGADHRRVVQAQQDHRLDDLAGRSLDVVDLGPGRPLVERHGPEDPVDPPDPVEVVLDHRLDVVDVQDVGVHHPEVGPGRVRHLAGGPQHQAAEDRPLLRDQERGERQPHDDPEELGPVAGQHLQRDPAHPIAPFSAGCPCDDDDEVVRPRRDSKGSPHPRAARVNRVT